jgi:Domain of unknown function (DUF4386)
MSMERDELTSGQRDVLRWGGIAGVVGGLCSVITFVILLALVPAAPSDPSALVARWPNVRTATIVGESILLAGYILFVMLFLALYQALRGTSPAPALFGSGVGILGYVLFIVGGLPPVAFNTISDLYHSSTATATDQMTLAWVWQGTQALFNETDTMGFILLSIGFILLGIAMLHARGFGKIFGWLSIIIALLALADISLFSVASTSFAPLALLIITVQPLLLGWRLYSLSKSK